MNNKSKLLEYSSEDFIIGYHPSMEKVYENPPRFTWVPESDLDIQYILQICDNQDFIGANVITKIVFYNFATLSETLEPGTYYWRYTIADGKSEYSKIRKFVIENDAVKTPLIERSERYKNSDMTHPRIWLNQTKIMKFQECLKQDTNYCGFDTFEKESVIPRCKSEFVKEPCKYPNDKRVVPLWRKNYQDCEEAVEYIRSFAVAGLILENRNYIERAILGLMKLVDWDVNGATNRDYNDEGSFRVAYGIAFGYDWLYNYLSLEQRQKVLHVLFIRTKQIAHHIIIDQRVHESLYDSHAVRSLSSVLTPCCIAMLGEELEAQEWLDYTIEYFSILYTPWGGTDGGWAEGGMYWTSGMAFVLDALNTIKNFTDINLFQRPFFYSTGDFPLYCMPVDTFRVSFCDQSNLGKYPGYKTAYNMREFAGITGDRNYYWYYEQVIMREKTPDTDFFNKGWWDFSYDDMVYKYNYGKTFMQNTELDVVKWFKDVGWVAINYKMKDPQEHIFMLTKSSNYGSLSHSHGDQNAILIFAFGEPLLIESGYYIGYNTTMHLNWRKQTKSKNAVLINGKGQYVDNDRKLQLAAKGKICEVVNNEKYIYIKEDAIDAYISNVPDIKKCIREIYFVDNSYFIVIDSIETAAPSYINLRNHSMHEFNIFENKFNIEGINADLYGQVIYCQEGLDHIAQDNDFEGVDQNELKDLENHWNLSILTKNDMNHKVVTLYIPQKKNNRKNFAYEIETGLKFKRLVITYDGEEFVLNIGT